MSNLHSPKLTASFVKSVKPGKRTAKFTDSHGLTLFVQPSGSRQWVQRLVIQGKRREFGLGGYPMVTLAEAREKAFENRRIARSGGDPRHQRNPAVPTFLEATRAVHAIHGASWKNDKQRGAWIDEIGRIVWPAVGHLRVDAITTAQLTEVFKPIWLVKPSISNRVRQRTEKVFDWAISQGYATLNPAGAPLKANLTRQPKGSHFKAIAYIDISGALDAVSRTPSEDATKMAFAFVVHTACRPGEVYGAQWAEIDMRARTWEIPASRMKVAGNGGHRVPLSDTAMEILERARGSNPNPTGYVFVSRRKKPVNQSTVRKMLKDAGFNATVHGVRSSFRDWCSETGKNAAVAESALAHKEKDSTVAAYARSDLFDLRRELMQEWADYLKA